MVKIKPNIYWVGGVDWNLRNFHGYTTEEGSSYNSYLITDEKVVLIDTVKDYLYDEMIDRISRIIDPSKIDIIISNHVEMDHSGVLPKIAEVAKNAKLYASPQGVIGLKEHFPDLREITPCEEGAKLNIGKYNLTFHLAKMLHWPDNMAVYLEEERILFSNDAFGQHIASSVRFDDEFSEDMLFRQAMKYYANIVQCYNAQVLNFAKTAIIPNEIDMICPSHGIIYRKYVKEIISKYIEWANNTVKNKAVIVYDTMWQSTEILAKQLQYALEENGIEALLRNLEYSHISDIMTDVLDASLVAVGSPTLNNNMLPTVSAFLCYLKGLAPSERMGFAFGSYGWGGQGTGFVNEALKSLNKWDIPIEPVKVRYIPNKEDLLNMHKTGESLAEIIKKSK